MNTSDQPSPETIAGQLEAKPFAEQLTVEVIERVATLKAELDAAKCEADEDLAYQRFIHLLFVTIVAVQRAHINFLADQVVKQSKGVV